MGAHGGLLSPHLGAKLASCMGIFFLFSPKDSLSLVWLSLLPGLLWAKLRMNGSAMGTLFLGLENSKDRLLVE